MVSRAIIFSLCILFAINSVRADLKLVPEIAEYELDGVPMRRLVFFDGPERVTYTPPANWKYTSSNDNLFVLYPSRGPSGEATITRMSLARPEIFDDETIKRLTDEIVLAAPNGAKNVIAVSQEKNPVMIERKETLLIIIKYDFYGDPQERSVLIVNRKNEQLRFQLTCAQTSFPQLHKAFLSSHFSWQNL